MNKVSLLVRKLTVPPIFAALLLIVTYAARPDYYGNVWSLLLGICFLAVLPSLAYPLQKYIPHFKDKGREGQRSLAMLFSGIGYLLGTLTAFIFNAPAELKIIYLLYLFSGLLMIIFNKVLKIEASGHACGIVGPIVLLVYYKLYIPAVIGALFVAAVFVSSIKTKRHTPSQLVIGSIIPIVCIIIAHLIIG